MPGHNLYVYLRGGRGDAFVTDSWDGQSPDEEGTLQEGVFGQPGYVAADGEGIEVSEPYRDIFTASTQMAYRAGGATGFTPTVSSAVILTTAEVTPATPAGNGGVVATYGSLTGDVEPSTSDEIQHVKPRQFRKVCTWLMFKETGTSPPTFKFRKADVIGWGKHARL